MENSNKKFNNPFGERPWLHTGSAASAAHSHTTDPTEVVKIFKGVLAGGLTGAVECSVTFPTDYVKTQLQLDEKGKKQYAGVFDCVKKTIKSHGFFGLYRGFLVVLFGNIPKHASRFGAFETFKGKLVDKNGHLSGPQKFMCGLLAGVVEGVVAVTPTETIKVKFINDRRKPEPQFKGLLQGIRLIVQKEGFSGLYQGVVPTVLRCSTNQAIRFYVMESFFDYYRGDDKTKHIPKFTVATVGVIAGIISTYGNTPIDVVKTRMQGLEAAKYKSMWDCTKQIMRKEGFAGLYKGTVPRLGKCCLDVAVTFTMYSTFLELINKL